MGRKLKIARYTIGLKAKDVAAICGISTTYYSRLENNKAQNPSKVLMLKISKVLKASVEELFFNE